MAKQFKITTTGTPTNFIVGGRKIVHPETDLDLALEFGLMELYNESSFQDAIDTGKMTVTDEGGETITTIRDQFTPHTLSKVFTNVIKDKVDAMDDVVTDVAHLPTQVAGVITLDKDYMVQGTVVIPYSIDLAGFRLAGSNINSDILAYVGATNFFAGANGGTLENLTLAQGGPPATLFNLDDTVGDKNIFIRKCIKASWNSLGTIKGYLIAFIDLCLYADNVDGITYDSNENTLLNNLAWFDSNTGTFETFVGNIDVAQIKGGFYDVPSGSTGIDVSGIGTVGVGEFIGSPFKGLGTYSVGTFSTTWTVDTPGIDLEGDKFSSGWIKATGNTTNTPLTVDVPAILDIPNATLDASSHRFVQYVPDPINFPYVFQYVGVHKVTQRVVATMTLSRIGGGTNTYELLYVKNGVPVPDSNTFIELSGTDGVAVLVTEVEFETDDYIYVGVYNRTDNDDILCKDFSLTV